MSRDTSGKAPEENLTTWLTESRQQMQEDQKLASKFASRGSREEECFATLPLVGQDKLRAKLKAEMNKDYNEFLSRQKRGRHVDRGVRNDSEVIPNGLDRTPTTKSILRDPPADEVPDRKDHHPERKEPLRRDPLEFDRPYQELERRGPMGPPPLVPRYDPLDELRLRRYFEDQLHSAARQGYPGYPPLPDAYRYNPYVNYYHNMDRMWGPSPPHERELWRGAGPQEKKVTFPQEWPEESDLYGWARQGRRSEMKIRDPDREERGGETRARSESPLNRSKSAPPDKKGRVIGGFMDGFGSGDRGREEEMRRREVYARELKEQIRSKQVEHSTIQDAKRTTRSSRPPTPPTQRAQTEARSQLPQFDSPPSRYQPGDPMDYYKSPTQPDHSSMVENREEVHTYRNVEKSSDDKLAYKRELEKQIEESRHRKEKQARETAKARDDSVGEWNPWGKGGAGAPLKDNSGRVVADLKVLNKANQAREKTGSSPKLEALADICELQNNLSPNQKQQESQSQASSGEGAHTPIPSTSKEAGGMTSQQEYREYLRQQVEDKKARKRAEEARIREEDRREAERLERDRLKLQEDYQRELVKQREQEEAVRRKNEEMKIAAEERRRANQGPSPKERRRVRGRRPSSPDPPAPVSTYQPPERTQAPSPPIPTLRRQQGADPPLSPYPEQPPHVLSPPAPAPKKRVTPPPPVPSISSTSLPSPHHVSVHSPLQLDSDVTYTGNNTTDRDESQSDFVRQLTDMKQQLMQEKDRVKEQLERSRTEMDETVSRRNIPRQPFQQLPAPNVSNSTKPPFTIKKSSFPVRTSGEPEAFHRASLPGGAVRGEEKRTVGFHLQNTQPKSNPYHREYEPLLKGRDTPPNHSRPDSTGSNASISTLDIEALALRNDDRMKRLESILRGNRQLEGRKPSPEAIIKEFLTRGPTRENKPPS